MSVTPSDHQWDAVKHAAHWFHQAQSFIAPAIRPKPTYESCIMDGENYADALESWKYDCEVGGSYHHYLGRGLDYFTGGYAGTGKSTILPFVIEEMGLDPKQVAFCAPTGKAAKVMTSKLRDFGIFQKAVTIHSLIYMPQSERADAIKIELDQMESHHLWLTSKGYSGDRHLDPSLEGLSAKEVMAKITNLGFELHDAMDQSNPRFTRRERSEFPPNVRLIVVDEGSMVAAEQAEDLAFFGIPIFVMGDPGQLPPINAEYGFNVTEPDFFLTEIHRQAADNPIIHLATLTREGKDLKVGDYGNGVQVVLRRDDKVTLDMSREAMVLCGTNRKRWSLTKQIRRASGFTETGPGQGEPLLVCRNHQTYKTMVNGTLFECMEDYGDLINGNAEIDLTFRDFDTNQIHSAKCTQGLFEEHVFRKKNAYSASSKAAFMANKRAIHMDFGHVLTCHKSQGSQWDEVIVHDESATFREDRYRWLYTAITRASERLTVVQ